MPVELCLGGLKTGVVRLRGAVGITRKPTLATQWHTPLRPEMQEQRTHTGRTHPTRQTSGVRTQDRPRDVQERCVTGPNTQTCHLLLTMPCTAAEGMPRESQHDKQYETSRRRRVQCTRGDKPFRRRSQPRDILCAAMPERWCTAAEPCKSAERAHTFQEIGRVRRWR